METNSNSSVSSPAFSSLSMGEKSTNSLNCPNIENPNNHNQCNDGLIKIISPTDVSRLDIKENDLSTNSSSSNVPTIFMTSTLKSTNAPLKAPIDLHKVFHDDQENEFTEYQQIPRQIFMSTICHVSST